nr:hypothetical protein [Auritidibacter sp. NML120636]
MAITMGIEPDESQTGYRDDAIACIVGISMAGVRIVKTSIDRPRFIVVTWNDKDRTAQAPSLLGKKTSDFSVGIMATLA